MRFEDIPVVDVTKVRPLSGYRLALEFSDGKAGVFDAKPYLSWPAFQALQDPSHFERAFVDHGTVAWPGNIDFAPDRLWTDVVTDET